MKQLLLEPGDILKVQNTTLPGGTFIKIQPQSVDFLDITDPKAVYIALFYQQRPQDTEREASLETALNRYTTITKGDIVELNYNDKVYELLMLELKPEGRAIAITDRDIEVDFAPPVGYVEPTPVPRKKEDFAIPAGSSLLQRNQIMLPKDIKQSQHVEKKSKPQLSEASRMNGKPIKT